MKKTGWYKLLDTLIWWQTAWAYPFKTTLQPEMLKTRQLVVGWKEIDHNVKENIQHLYVKIRYIGARILKNR